MPGKRKKEVLEKLLKDKICKFQFYKIDENGLLEFGQDLIDPELKEPPEGYVDVPPPEGLYQPKWDGDDWIEVGEPPAVDPNEPPPPTTIEALQKEIRDLKKYIADLVDENKLKLPVVKEPKDPKSSTKGDK